MEDKATYLTENYNYKKSSSNNSFKKYLIVLILTLLIGITLGAFFANNLNYEMKYNLSKFLTSYLDDGIISGNKKDMFKISFFRYGRIVFLMWIVAFLPIGFVLNSSIILLKGLSYGFTTAFLIINFGLLGLKNSLSLYFFQNLFIIPAMLIIGVISFLKNLSKNSIINGKKISIKSNIRNEEILVLILISVILVFLATVIEIFFII